MRTVTVNLGDRSYPIYIGADLLGQDKLIAQHIHGKQVLIVSNETVQPLYLDELSKALHGFEYKVLVLPDGEKYKTLDSLDRIFTSLLENNFDRNCTLIALGGGVIGDITGYAAASYQRGVNFLQIPTTLLAQVDSSVGGKTAVNHPLGKNMIGAFYQPKCVISDTKTLNTLPARELKAGLVEVIKYGLIRDAEFFNWLESNAEAIVQCDQSRLATAVEKSCINKARIVIEDEREQGIRALLNLGHTFGHAIETFVSYENWLHGEAVSVGILMAAEFSNKSGYLPNAALQRIKKLFNDLQLPHAPPADMTAGDFIELMSRDKKVQDRIIRLILLKEVGHGIISSDYNMELLHQYLREKTNGG